MDIRIVDLCFSVALVEVKFSMRDDIGTSICASIITGSAPFCLLNEAARSATSVFVHAVSPRTLA